jgi:predicted AAA+ superfamily ATPase
LIKSLQKYSRRAVVTKSSSPKLIPLCGALIDRSVLKTDEGFGRAFEAAVGACLINNEFEVFYWRDGNTEVDFVTKHEGNLFAIEVKLGKVLSVLGRS